MSPEPHQSKISASKEMQQAISQSSSPQVATNQDQDQDQAPQALSAALAMIRHLNAENATLKQNYTQLRPLHAILRIKYNIMVEDHERAIVNEDTVEEENDLLRAALEEMREKYEEMTGERDIAVRRLGVLEEEEGKEIYVAGIFLEGLEGGEGA